MNSVHNSSCARINKFLNLAFELFVISFMNFVWIYGKTTLDNNICKLCEDL